MSDEGMSEGEYQAMWGWEGPGEPPSSLSELPGYWRTRDGRVLKIVEMKGQHIDNAIALFEDAGWSDHPKIVELRKERERR